MEYFAFQWHITDECDQRCRHCYIFSEGHPALIAMPWEQMKSVLANIERMCQRMHRLPYLYITGGDPILHPRFWDLLKLVHQHGIPFTLMGNPFHLTDDVCRRMKQLGCRKYQLSLDGLVERHVYAEIPPRVEYTLTPRAHSLIPLLDQLVAWALHNLSGIVNSRKLFTQKASR